MDSDDAQVKAAGPGAPARAGVLTKCILFAAIVLPLVSLGTCSTALGAMATDGSVEIALVIFGLSLVAGFIAMMFLLFGRARRLAAIAFGLSAAGVIANIAEFFARFHYTRGRQLRGPQGRVLPAREPRPFAVSPRARAARGWRDNGDTETASVSAFSLLSLDLAQLGAPLSLSRAAHEDALDEIRHAELCYELARSFGGDEVGGAAMPGLAAIRGRNCTLYRVAVESWIEGAYLETVSAALASELRAGVAERPVRATLDVIAADEARHAQHAWAVIEWCLKMDFTGVAPALREAMERIPAPDPRDDEPGSDGSLEPLGIPGRDRQRAIATRCLAESKARLGERLRAAAA